MKKNILISLCSFCIGALVGFFIFIANVAHDKIILDNSRKAIITLNKKYNLIYDNLTNMAFTDGDRNAYYAVSILQAGLFKEILNVNKSLKLDCIKYRENGTPVILEEKDGKKGQLQVLPEEIKIIK